MIYLLRCTVLLVVVLTPGCLVGQTIQQTKTAYYFDINKASALAVHELQEPSLNIQYDDRYGTSPEVRLVLLNWKRERVATYTLSKSFGLNHFKINLGQVFEAWREGDVYTCTLTDEMKNSYELLIKKNTSVTNPPEVDIFSNPISLSCKQPGSNLVDFYGTIRGGKAPYTVNWYVVNEAKTGFLFQPRTEIIERPGNSMAVRVDSNPSYYVMMVVVDACQKEAKKMVYLTCKTTDKNVNTIFVEPLKDVSTVTTRSSN